MMVIGISLLVFPKLALGLSGFETGVAVMPLVKGDPTDTEEKPKGRIRNTKKLLLRRPNHERDADREQLRDDAADPSGGVQTRRWGTSRRARLRGVLSPTSRTSLSGTSSAPSTTSARYSFSGLRALRRWRPPQYHSAISAAIRDGPGWTRAMRPLVIILTIIAFGVTFIFKADVNAQGGAYATGVLVLMSSAAVAVTISALRRKEKGVGRAFAIIALVFAYTTVVNVIERPDGIKIAGFSSRSSFWFHCSPALRAPLNCESSVSRSTRQRNALSMRRPPKGRSASSPTILKRATRKSIGGRLQNIARIITFRLGIPSCFLK